MRSIFIILILVVFLALTGTFYALSMHDPAYHFRTLETGNSIMAILSLGTWLMVMRQTTNSNPQAFIRGVYSASFLKLMVCMVSMLVFVLLNRVNIHKPTIFILFGIYGIYTAMETIVLAKSVKQ
jgi:hypothetical protein